MEENKRNKKEKGLIITLAIFIFITLGLASYICYDKFIISNSTTSSETKKTSSKNQLNNKVEENNSGTNEITNSTTSNEQDETDINKNQSLKFYYYASKQDETENQLYRYSITLSESNTNNGFFTIDVLNEFEHPTGTGYYKIENNKLTLSVGPFVESNNFASDEFTFTSMGATLTNDPSQENYKAYTLDYNEDVLQIGKVKLYKVK